MANRYDNPAQADFINSYVPLPFEQLYNIGRTMVDRVDKAQKELSDFTEKNAKFRSLSNVDTNKFYDLTLGKVQPIVQELVKNPDLIKTPEGRRMISGTINNIDYASLAKLEQSKANMDLRNEMNAKLSMAGKYNPFWHDVNFGEYDTLNNGLFSDTNVTPYETIQEGASKYYDNLKDTLLEDNGVWQTTGVNQNTIDRVTNQNVNAYANTVAGQNHMKEAIAKGLTTPENAVNWLGTQMKQIAQEYVRETKTLNPKYILDLNMAMKQAEINQRNQAAAMRASKSGSKTSNDNEGHSYWNEVDQSANIKAMNVLRNYDLKPSPSFSSQLDQFGKEIKNNKFTNDLKNSKNIQDMTNKLQIAVNNGLIDSNIASNILQTYQADRQFQAGAEVFKNNQDLVNKLKVNISQDLVRGYFDIDVSQANKNFRIETEDNVINDTFGKVNVNFLKNALPVNTNGRIVSDIDNSVFRGKMKQVNPAFAKRGAAIGAGRDASLNMPTTQDNTGTGVITYVLNNIKTAYMAPTGTIFGLGSNNNNGTTPTYFSNNKVLVPKKEVKDAIKKYIKDNDLDVSVSNVLDLMQGKYSEGRAGFIKDVGTTKMYDNYKSPEEEGSNAKGTKAKNIDFYEFELEVPTGSDFNMRRISDDKMKKSIMGASAVRKDVDFSQDEAAGVALDSDINIGIDNYNR